jgi:hypothetical protein
MCSVVRKESVGALAAQDLVPSAVAGVQTDVIETGVIHAQQGRTGRWRPAPGGVSIGHTAITAGTLGGVLQRISTGEFVVLSNNHVLADSNDGEIGDAILQPGPVDGGQVNRDELGTLLKYIPIRFEGEPEPPPPDDPPGEPDCPIAGDIVWALNMAAARFGSRSRVRAYRETPPNLVDAAIMHVDDFEAVTRDILEIGVPTGVAEAALDLPVQKSGRTTGHTTGQITQIAVTVSVSYGGGRVALFTDQIATGNMSSGGDSGSLLLDVERRVVGLLFAGSSSITVYNRIQNVLSGLDLLVPRGS